MTRIDRALIEKAALHFLEWAEADSDMVEASNRYDRAEEQMAEVLRQLGWSRGDLRRWITDAPEWRAKLETGNGER